MCMGNGGEHFFDEAKQDVFLKQDFYMCVEYDKFPFVIEIDKDELGFVTRTHRVIGE